ncbi:hypothetical protein F4556_000379 [Kitasatospora gansuensis]|uniref:Uncharacterized protein n=1 Tax=Kitasatospora gansuensis TaxID=258050 RepID=A0A7W7S6M4_9ACTN|nr:hypothetical protein [Kitasatospora gansuensis]MBB4944844.1 hypothetical protein [Kitasatospora gansuensis]
MTRYCVDPVRHELIASWGSGEGDLATLIAAVPAGTDTGALSRLASVLTQLSSAAWHTYTHSVGGADSLEPDSEGWHRERERKAFEEVAQAVATPHLPQGGSITVSYSPLVENANRVGRALLALGLPELTAAVRTDIAAELAAVEAAELGDLTGRAQQAVLLSREDASPVQVAAADRLLHANPFGSAALFSDVDPTAAAVAAAHWLYAAAEAVSEVSGQALTDVVREADNIEALPYETPTLVLELLDAGASPYDVVTGLVRHALRVADGVLPDPAAFREQLEEAEELLAEYTDDEEETDLRLTPLDPKRPSRDLLEDLITGIQGCWLLHDAYEDGDEDEEEEEDEHEDLDDAQAEQQQQHSREAFLALVRATAAQHHDRLI